MIRYGFTIAAFAALPLAPAIAADPLSMPVAGVMPGMSGYVEAFGEVAWDRVGDGDYAPWWGGGGTGRVNLWLSETWSTQFDAAGGLVAESFADTYSIGSLNGTVHVSYRDPSRMLIGGFGQLGAFGDYADSTSIFGAIGGEAQFYHDRMTFYGQVAVIKGLSGVEIENYPMDLGLARLAVRYFPADNTRIEAGIGYVGGPIWGSGYEDTDSIFWNVELEHRHDNSPWSLFAEAAGIHGGGYHDWQSVNRVMVGARMHFGSGSLLDLDRNGATLEGIDGSLVSWLRWE